MCQSSECNRRGVPESLFSTSLVSAVTPWTFLPTPRPLQILLTVAKQLQTKLLAEMPTAQSPC